MSTVTVTVTVLTESELPRPLVAGVAARANELATLPVPARPGPPGLTQ